MVTLIKHSRHVRADQIAIDLCFLAIGNRDAAMPIGGDDVSFCRRAATDQGVRRIVDIHAI